MISIVLAATTTTTAGLPIWVVVLGFVLAGGSIAGLFQYLSKRNETAASSSTTEATANLTGVEALTNVITSLSQENGRLTTRLTDFSSAFDRVEKKLDESRDLVTGLRVEITAQTALLEARPTKDDLIAQVGRLIEQLATLGATPTNGSVKAPP